jgi:iron-regulated transporter 1
MCKKDQVALRVLNAQMRRIDLMCKLLGPLFIALLHGSSTENAVVVNFAMTIASVLVEYFAIARVYHTIPELQEPKQATRAIGREYEESQEPDSLLSYNWNCVNEMVKKAVADFTMYFHHSVFLPSIAGALLYLTVLNFTGQVVTCLL